MAARKCVVLCVLGFLVTPIGAADKKFASHSPMRPLPTASKRPLDKGPAYYVDAVKGDDGNDGSLAKPWKTAAHGVSHLKLGDTLYLRGGIYYEHVVVSVAGTGEKPITIRSYPGEIAILDGGLREFFENPAGAWEPCPDGAAGEYRSRKTYPGLGGTAGNTNVLGRFGDSMVPLHGYRFHSDLRSSNEYWNLKKNVGEDEKGIYCGPGVFYDTKTERIHIRLAHTTLKMLGNDNYRGETDPRKLPLVIGGLKGGPALALRGARHIRVQDLVVRGTRGAIVEIDDCLDIELEGLTIYGGSPAILVRETAGLRVLNTACRGIAAPWTFRGSLKYRATEARIFSASHWEPTGRDNHSFELAYCEFTDSVDGVFIGNVKGVRFHHNLLDNVSDDGVFLTSQTAFDGTTPGGDIHLYQNVFSRCLTTLAFGVGNGRQKAVPAGRQTGAGVHVYRNVFDFRRLVHYHIPALPSAPEAPFTYGRFASDHGSPTWEPMNIYHNTFIADDQATYAYGTAGLASAMGGGTKRRVFNNIVVQLQGLPGSFLPSPTIDFQGDGNLFWSIKAGPDFKGDLFAKFKAKGFKESKARYEPGWTAHDVFADPKFVKFNRDWKTPLDLRLQRDSPAIDAGVPIPASWPDPARKADAGKPDIGVVPVAAEPWRVGVRGRLTMFGEEKPGAPPVLDPPAFPGSSLPGRKKAVPAALVRGYPARDGAFIHFVLRKHGFDVDASDKSGAWLDTRDYSKYRVVVIAGNLIRAKLEPNKYTKEDLPRVQSFLENGGTLLLMRLGPDVFASPEGREYLARLTGAGPLLKAPKPDMTLRQPNHPWVKHVNAKDEMPWLNHRLTIPLRATKGEAITGNTAGDQTTLYRQRVGKGQLIYLGWEISEFLPSGSPKTPSTVAQEKLFEDQITILANIVADVR